MLGEVGRWIERAGQRRKRYYRLTAAGRKALAKQRSAWDDFFGALTASRDPARVRWTWIGQVLGGTACSAD